MGTGIVYNIVSSDVCAIMHAEHAEHTSLMVMLYTENACPSLPLSLSLSLSLPFPLLSLPSFLSLSLFVEKLPKHPEYAKALPADRMKIKKLLKVAFPRAMELKEKLKLQYEKEKEELERKVSWCYRI